MPAFNNTIFGQSNQCAFKIPVAQAIIAGPGNLLSRATPVGLRPANNTVVNDTLYTLPVVVHVIHSGSIIGATDNPDDSLIYAMIDGLNKAWRKSGLLYGGVDMKIQFQLAKRSPSCNSTSGINRVDGSSIPGYVSGGITNFNIPGSVTEEHVKRLSRWPNTDYINIWIVNKINGSGVAPGGYAYFPEYNSAITDGLVLLAGVVNGTNKTITHEMGHYFSLFHSFYDDSLQTTCAVNNICALQGDRICDTEPCLLQYDCTNATNSCTGNAYLVTDTPNVYTVLNNYMGYTDCQWMFTSGQKNRVRDALLAFRYGLISSGALSGPSPATPAVACIPTAAHGHSPYYGVQQLDFNTLHIYSNTSGADSSIYFDRTCNQSVTVTKGQTYPITVTGSYLNPHRIKVFIDYNNNGSFTDPGELVLSGYNSVVTATVTIPLTSFPTRTPLRMRVVADNPALPEPGACTINGTATEGAGQAEDYAVVVLPRQIYSVNSGLWNFPATWSCNCIPANDDEVVIKATHLVTLSNAVARCGKLSLEPGSSFTGSENLKISGEE